MDPTNPHQISLGADLLSALIGLVLPAFAILSLGKSVWLVRRSLAALVRARTRLLQRRFAAGIAEISSVGDVSDGDTVRVVGRVTPLRRGHTQLQGAQAVAWHSRLFTQQGDLVLDTSHGEDFLLELQTGEQVLVLAQAAGQHQQLCLDIGHEKKWHRRIWSRGESASFREQSLQPFDTVEVVGVVQRTVSSQGRAQQPRGIPTLCTLSHTGLRPLAIRGVT